MNTIQKCVDELLEAGKDDFVYLGEVIRIVESAYSTTPAELRARTLEVIKAVLSDGLMELGDLKREGFFKWELPEAECVRRVDREWQAMEKDPSLPFIVWLRNTPKGDESAERISL